MDQSKAVADQIRDNCMAVIHEQHLNRRRLSALLGWNLQAIADLLARPVWEEAEALQVAKALGMNAEVATSADISDFLRSIPVPAPPPPLQSPDPKTTDVEVDSKKEIL